MRPSGAAPSRSPSSGSLPRPGPEIRLQHFAAPGRVGVVMRSRATDEDDDLFAATYREHFAALVRVAFLLTGSNEGAEDAVHDTFLRCRTRLADLEDPRSYLRAAVVNECRSVHRRARRGSVAPP